MKTALKILIDYINENGVNIDDINKFIEKEGLKSLDRQQIIDAFEEGHKYGNSDFQTFDYPASRYFGFTYPEYYENRS